jgi:hypothetical protein
MKEQILSHLNDPAQLEKMYRAHKAPFTKEFKSIYPEVKGNNLADFWNERLQYENEDTSWGTSAEWIFIIVASLIAGVIAKIPAFFSIDDDFFYPRNIGFIVFPALVAFFAWRNSLSTKKIVLLAGAMIAGLLFINLLPKSDSSDTLALSCIHLVLFLWSILSVAFVGEPMNNAERRLGFLKYNGDLVVITALILLAGGILSGITIGLFSVIGFSIEKFYFEYIVVFGLAAAPIIGTYLIQTNPQLVGKVSPVIARIFSPLVLVMLAIYLGAMLMSGKDPYKDREFLVIFNALLIGVMAIIFFSVAETSRNKTKMEIWTLFLLSGLTIIVNGIALSAILFRISEWGFTPNRTAILGGNILILVNLVLVAVPLLKAITQQKDINGVGKAIASYLPLYFVWTIIVTFLFPFLFGYK